MEFDQKLELGSTGFIKVAENSQRKEAENDAFFLQNVIS